MSDAYFSTNFPQKPDDLMVYTDITNDTKPYLDQYKQSIAAGDYITANKIKKEHLKNSIIDAALLNRHEQQIITLQSFMLTDIDKYLSENYLVITKDEYAKNNNIKTVTLPAGASNWISDNSERTGYYKYETPKGTVSHIYVENPQWSLIPINNKIPSEQELDVFNDLAAMYADASDASNPKLIFYTQTIPTISVSIGIKGVV